MLTVLNWKAEMSNLLKTTQGNGPLATDLLVCIQMSEGDPRAGTFHQTRVNTGDTTGNVMGY